MREISTLFFVFLVCSCNAEKSRKLTEEDRAVLKMLAADNKHLTIQPFFEGFPICYEGIGCFEKGSFGFFPERPNDETVKFKLFSQESDAPLHVYNFKTQVGNENDLAVQALKNKSRPLVFVAHGYASHGEVDWVKEIRQIQTKGLNANVVVVDWGHAAKMTTIYNKAAANAVMVGRIAANLALRLSMEYEIPVKSIQFVGHSLGGQMSGFFARYIHEATQEKVGKLSCLDSASPLFEPHGIVPNKEFTHFLEAVHTSAGNTLWMGKVGVERNYGHVDFYPNGGVNQPGCLFPHVSCSHSRATAYYIEAIQNESQKDSSDHCHYDGFICESVTSAQSGDCEKQRNSNDYIAMNGAEQENQILFLKTKPSAPFCWNNYNI